MASLLSGLMGKSKVNSSFNFHNDESLHAETPQARAWYSNLGGEISAVVNSLSIIRAQGPEQGAKNIAGSLDLNDPLSQLISKKLVSMLWGSMLHPPPSYRGLEYRYRTPDGSHNSVLFPHLGKAGSPYAKTVPSKRPLLGARPDPGDMFDLLMARKDEGIVSGSGVSMMLLYMATLIIHDIFRTDDHDSNCSATSAYIDLSPLYGNDIESQRAVRQMKNGLLKPDTFAETRLLAQPPGVCIYIIMYNRFHNYVAAQLKDINEHGRFSLPPGCEDTEEARKNPKFAKAFEAQDEHLFQTARLVTCGMFYNIAIFDYLRVLMGVHELDTPWTLDPAKDFPEKGDKRGLDRGEGNMVSLEFSMLYRFHSPISRRDAEWTEALFIGMLRPYIDDSDTPEAREAIAKGTKFTSDMVINGEVPFQIFKAWLDRKKQPKTAEEAAKDPNSLDNRKKAKYFPDGLDFVGGSKERPYRFMRGKDGLFDTAQLAAEMIRAIEDPICQFGAQQTPRCFRPLEIMGIMQARKWEVATLNEFREFFGMSRFKTFEEINSNKEIQDRLRDLYEDPDLVEFYPGLFLEGQGRNIDPGTPMPGGEQSSLWRGVFSDAVTLIRSDRFYTHDFNASSLTAWGWNEVTTNPKINKGSVMNRLFERAFPGCFDYNSLHLWQPFYIPSKNLEVAHRQGYLNLLNLDGLEDSEGNTHQFYKENQQVYYGKQKVGYGTWKEQVQKDGLRRKLEVKGDMKWRGDEYVKIAKEPVEVSSFQTIRGEILGGPNSMNWSNPVILEPSDMPWGPLRQVMDKQWDGWKDAIEIVTATLPSDWEQTFMDYFVGIAQDFRLREQRPFQRRKIDNKEVQVYQFDIVKDLAIPAITRFIADLIGFWEEIKTPQFTNRKYVEGDIYQHIENCQNFESYDSDPTKTWERRKAFQDSVKVLKALAEQGVKSSLPGWLENVTWWRSYGKEGDNAYVCNLRKIGVNLTQALTKRFAKTDQVAAIMLYTALDTAQRFVLTFTEVVAFFIDTGRRDDWYVTDPKVQVEKWREVKKLAFQDTTYSGTIVKKIALKTKDGKNDEEITKQLEQYVLEASRLTNKLDIARIYDPINPKKKTTEITVSGGTKQTISRGETILLDLRAAYADPASGVKNPDDFELRSLDQYIGFGPTVSVTDPGEMVAPRFSKRATIIGVTGLFKHVAHLSDLRVAHDKAGRLKRVITPDGQRRYASPQWDHLLAFPTTWCLRFDGVGESVYDKGDNSNQGYGEDMLWEYESLIDTNAARTHVAKNKKQRDEKEFNEAVRVAVEKVLKERESNSQQNGSA